MQRSDVGTHVEELKHATAKIIELENKVKEATRRAEDGEEQIRQIERANLNAIENVRIDAEQAKSKVDKLLTSERLLTQKVKSLESKCCESETAETKTREELRTLQNEHAVAISETARTHAIDVENIRRKHEEQVAALQHTLSETQTQLSHIEAKVAVVEDLSLQEACVSMGKLSLVDHIHESDLNRPDLLNMLENASISCRSAAANTRYVQATEVNRLTNKLDALKRSKELLSVVPPNLIDLGCDACGGKTTEEKEEDQVSEVDADHKVYAGDADGQGVADGETKEEGEPKTCGCSDDASGTSFVFYGEREPCSKALAAAIEMVSYDTGLSNIVIDSTTGKNSDVPVGVAQSIESMLVQGKEEFLASLDTVESDSIQLSQQEAFVKSVQNDVMRAIVECVKIDNPAFAETFANTQ